MFEKSSESRNYPDFCDRGGIGHSSKLMIYSNANHSPLHYYGRDNANYFIIVIVVFFFKKNSCLVFAVWRLLFGVRCLVFGASKLSAGRGQSLKHNTWYLVIVVCCFVFVYLF